MWRGLLGASAVGRDLKSPGRQEYYAANVKSSVYVMMGTREKQGRWDCKKNISRMVGSEIKYFAYARPEKALGSAASGWKGSCGAET